MNRKSSPRPMEILMVEDSLTAARVTIGALKCGRFEHRLTWLKDGTTALDFLFRRGRYRRAPRPDLVLLDLGLPGIDGLEVLAHIRSDAELRALPVVVMTASTASEDVLECERLGVESYLTKPVDLVKFLGLVQELRSYWSDDMIVPVGA
ncbi:MAG: response regulator [Planctomycetaceae bacterium]